MHCNKKLERMDRLTILTSLVSLVSLHNLLFNSETNVFWLLWSWDRTYWSLNDIKLFRLTLRLLRISIFKLMKRKKRGVRYCDYAYSHFRKWKILIISRQTFELLFEGRWLSNQGLEFWSREDPHNYVLKFLVEGPEFDLMSLAS